MGYIYKITNKKNNKSYIGQTSRSYKDRWADHKRDRFKEPYCNWPLYKMMNKVGLENVRVTISGSAPLSKDVLSFLRCVLNGVIIEGYGATETTGPTTLQVGTDYTVGNVGGILPCCDFKLVDVPDMGYLTYFQTSHR